MIRRSEGIVVLTCEYPPFPGGIGTYSGQVVQAVRDSGFNAVVIAPVYPDLPGEPDQSETHRIQGHHKITPRHALKILSILRRAPASSIFLAADIRSVLAAYVLHPFHRRPYRAMIHGSEVSKFNSKSPTAALVRRAYEAAELIAANSSATLDIFSRSFGDPKGGIVTHLGVDPSWFEAVDGGFENAQLASLPQGIAIVSTVGRIEPRKGQLETVRAIARARDRYGLAETVYVLAGRPEEQTYTAAVLDEGVRLGVHIVAPGRVSNGDLKRLYQRSACHVLFARQFPGKVEGFGLVLLEAAAQGCPSVTTAVGGIPEAMGETGTVVQSESVEETAHAIARYVCDFGLRGAAGARAREHARRFDWLACARATFPELPWPGRITAASSLSTDPAAGSP